MTGRRRTRWLGTALLGLLLAVAVGLEPGPAHAQDDPPFPPEDQPQPTQPAPQLPPPPPGETPLPDDPLEPIGPPEDPDLFDIPGQVNSAMHGFLASMVEIGMRIVVGLLSSTILATPDLTGNEQIRGLWTAMLVVANLTYVLFVVAGGFVVSARETLQTQYGFKEIVPRIVIAGLASNLSLLVVGQAISLVNAFTVGVSRNAIPDGAGAAVADTWDWAAERTGVNVLALLLALVIVALALIVLVTYIVRVAVMVVLIVSAPIVLLFHALPQTEKLAFLWWRALVGCFAIQAGQTLTLIVTIGVFLFPFGSTIMGVPTSGHGWLALLVAITMLWLMIKIPVWVKEYLWLNSRGVFRRLLFAYFLFRTMSAAAAGGRGGRGSGGGGTSSSGGPRPGPSGRSGSRQPRGSTRPSPATRRGLAGTRPGRGTPPGGTGGRPGAPGPGAAGDGPSTGGPGGPGGPGGGSAGGTPAGGSPGAAGVGTATRPTGAPPAGRSATRGGATGSPTSGTGSAGPSATGAQSSTPGAANQPVKPQVTPPVHWPTSWTGSPQPPVRLRASQAATPGPAVPRPGTSGRSQPGSPTGDARQPRRPAQHTPAAVRQPAKPKVTPPVRWPTSWR
jgi:hypothetical protein